LPPAFVVGAIGIFLLTAVVDQEVVTQEPAAATGPSSVGISSH